MTPPEGPEAATSSVPPLDGPPTQPAGRAGLGGPVGPEVAERAAVRLAGVRRRASELRWRRALAGMGTAVAGLGVAVISFMVAGQPAPVGLRVTALPGTTTTTAPSIAGAPPAPTTTIPASGGVPVSVVPTLAPPATAAAKASSTGSLVPVPTVAAVPTATLPPAPVAVDSVSASSPTEWWVLGSAARCSTSKLCLLHTTDGGNSYTATALPSQVTGGGRLSVSGNVLWLWNTAAAWSLTAGAGGNYTWAEVTAEVGHQYADVQGAGDGSAYALETCDGTKVSCAADVLQLKAGAAGAPLGQTQSSPPPVAVAAAGGEAWIAYQDGSVDSWSGSGTPAYQGSPCPKGQVVTDMAASTSPSAPGDVVVALCQAAPSGGSQAAPSGGSATDITPYVLSATGGWASQQSFTGKAGPATPLAVDSAGDVCAAAAGGLSCQSPRGGPVLFSAGASQQVTDVSVVSSAGTTAGLAVVATPPSATSSTTTPASGQMLRSTDGLHFSPAQVTITS